MRIREDFVAGNMCFKGCSGQTDVMRKSVSKIMRSVLKSSVVLRPVRGN
jgi:hypothetical protein